MNKVKSTYYVKYECDATHAAMEVFQKVFGVDFMINTLYENDDVLFWVDDTELVVTEVGSGMFRVDVLEGET